MVAPMASSTAPTLSIAAWSGISPRSIRSPSITRSKAGALAASMSILAVWLDRTLENPASRCALITSVMA